MTLKEKKLYVRKYPFIDSDVEKLQQEYAEVWEEAVNVTVQISMMPFQKLKSNTSGSRLDNLIVKLVEIKDKIKKLEKQKKTIERTLKGLKPQQRYILEKVDIEHQPMVKVAQSIGIPFDTLRRKRDRIYNRILG